MCFCLIKKNLKKNIIFLKKRIAAQKTDFNPKNHIFFGFFDLNSNKITYTCPRLIIYILSESL